MNYIEQHIVVSRTDIEIFVIFFIDVSGGGEIALKRAPKKRFFTY